MSDSESEKLHRMTLTRRVERGMPGAGAFPVPRDFAMATGDCGALRSGPNNEEQ